MPDQTIPPLPSGFKLETGAAEATATVPPLPDGFQLETGVSPESPAFSAPTQMQSAHTPKTPWNPLGMSPLPQVNHDVVREVGVGVPGQYAQMGRDLKTDASILPGEVARVVGGAIPVAGRGIINGIRGAAGLEGQLIEKGGQIFGKDNPVSDFGYSLRQEAANGGVAGLVDQPAFTDLITPKTQTGQLAQALLAAPIEFAPMAAIGLPGGASMASYSGLQSANQANKDLGEGDSRTSKMLGATAVGAGSGFVAGKMFPDTAPLSRAFSTAPWADAPKLTVRTALSRWLGEATLKTAVAAGTMTAGQVAEKSITGGELPDVTNAFLVNLFQQAGFAVAHGAAQAKGGAKAWNLHEDGTFSFKAEGTGTDGKPAHTWVTARTTPEGIVEVWAPVPEKPIQGVGPDGRIEFQESGKKTMAWVPVADLKNTAAPTAEAPGIAEGSPKAFEAQTPPLPPPTPVTPAAPTAPLTATTEAGTTTVQAEGKIYRVGRDGRPFVIEGQDVRPFDATRDDVSALEAIDKQQRETATKVDDIIHPYNSDGSPKTSTPEPVATPAEAPAFAPEAPSTPTPPTLTPDTYKQATAGLKAIEQAVTAQVVAQGGDLSAKVVKQKVQEIMRTDPAHAATVAHLNDLQQQGAFFNMNEEIKNILNPEPVETPATIGPDKVPTTDGRRHDAATRKAIEDMDPAEKDAEIAKLRVERHTDQLTGLKNRTAFDETPRKPFQLSMDGDALGAINKTYGQFAGDEVIKHWANALRSAGIDAYRYAGGDEFRAEGDNAEHLAAAFKKADAYLQANPIELTYKNGEVHHIIGGISHGIGESVKSADFALTENKIYREGAGLRPKHGDLPPRISGSAPGDSVNESERKDVPSPSPEVKPIKSPEERKAEYDNRRAEAKEKADAAKKPSPAGVDEQSRGPKSTREQGGGASKPVVSGPATTGTRQADQAAETHEAPAPAKTIKPGEPFKHGGREYRFEMDGDTVSTRDLTMRGGLPINRNWGTIAEFEKTTGLKVEKLSDQAAAPKPGDLISTTPAEDGMEVQVRHHDKGRFSVLLWDKDAGKSAGTTIFPTLERAEAYAKTLADKASPDKNTSAPIVNLMGSVSEVLDRPGGSLTNNALRALGLHAMGDGKFTQSDAADAAEAALNKHIEALLDYTKGSAWTNERALETIKTLDDEASRLPTQTSRDAEKVMAQQFSTPPSYAFIVSWVANIKPGEVALETSAGDGNIATQDKLWGAEVHVNEIAPRRVELLKQLGFTGVTNIDAGRVAFDPALKDLKPTVVTINPPFSNDSVMDRKDPLLGAKHVQQALSKLEDGGRLVAIVGGGINHDPTAQLGGMGFNNQTFRDWWDKMGSKYNIRANVLVDGSLYRKQGTSFDTRIIVIDKTTTNATWRKDAIQGRVDNYEDLLKLLEGVRNDRNHTSLAITGESKAPEPSGLADSPKSQPATSGPKPTSSPVNTGLGAGLGDKSRPPAKPGSGGRGKGSVVVSEPRSGISANNDERSGGKPSARGVVRPESGTSLSNGPDTVGGTAVERHDTNNRGLTEAKGTAAHQDEEVGDGTFATYRPERVEFQGAKPHPALLVQTASMAAARLPEPTIHRLNLPQSIIDSGALSDAQLEAALYAVNAFDRTTPIEAKDGTVTHQRVGFLVGDGTGVGKTREILAVLAHEMNTGMKRAVILTKSAGLLPDLIENMKALEMDPSKVIDLGKVKAGNEVKGDGILFTTYSTLRSSSKGKGGAGVPRLEQVQAWMGKDFDGMIVFDEAHEMSNAMGGEGGRGKVKASAKALAGLKIQNDNPSAKVLYASATAATEPRNLGYAVRLGLWGGVGSSFRNAEDFVGSMVGGGLGAMEMVAQDLKRRGLYISRNISFEGVSYETLRHDLTPSQVGVFDYSSGAWRKVFENMDQALGLVAENGEGNVDGKARGAARSAFYGSLQRYYNGLLTASMIPSMITSMEKDLAEGRSPVIQLTNTNEASDERQKQKAQDQQAASGEDELDLESLDMSPRVILMDYLENAFPIYQMVEVEVGRDDDGNPRTQMVTAKDDKGNPIVNPEAERIKTRMLSEFRSMPVPEGALHQILAHFGTDKVAEVTGRKERIVVKDGVRSIEKVPSRVSEINSFQDGKKLMLVFSAAGGTGASYDSDRRRINQRRRAHYLLQAGWQADAAVQGLGRSHRANQVQPPHIVLMTTNVKGHMRFISTIARRIAQLGALTKGERSAGGGGVFKAEDNLESTESRAALRHFWNEIQAGRADSITTQEVEDIMHLTLMQQDGTHVSDENLPSITQFLNRALVLPFDHQNEVFEEFMGHVKTYTEAAQANGTLDVGVQTIHALSAKEHATEEVFKDPVSKAATTYHNIETIIPNKKTAWETIPVGASNFAGFFKNKNSGAIYYARKHQTTDKWGGVNDSYSLRGVLAQDRRSEDKLNPATWEEITDPAKAETAWEEALAKTPDTRSDTVHLVTGVLLPIWNKLSSSQDSRVQVRRVKLDDGSTLLGRMIPAGEVSNVLNQLGAGGTLSSILKEMSPDQVFSNIVSDRQRGTSGDFVLRRGTIYGSPAVEILASGLSLREKESLAKKYDMVAQTSAGSYNVNLWVQNTPDAIAGLGRFLKDNPLESLASGSQRDSQRGSANMDLILAPAIAIMNGVSTASKIAKNLYDHLETLRGEDSRSFLETMDSDGITKALADHATVTPFWINQTQFQVEDGEAQVKQGDAWEPMTPEDFTAMAEAERAREDTSIQLLYAGLDPFKAFEDWKGQHELKKSLKPEAQKKAIGENFGLTTGSHLVNQASRLSSKHLNLPTRHAQNRPATFGWVYEPLKMWDQTVNQHETAHAEARRAMEALDPAEAEKLFKVMVEGRFTPNPEATAILREFHTTEMKDATARRETARKLIGEMEEYLTFIETLPDDDPNAGEWRKQAVQGRAAATALVSRLGDVIRYHRREAKNGEAQGIIHTPEELEKMGFSQQAMDANEPFINDLNVQFKKLEGYARNLAVQSSLKRRAQADDLRDQLADGIPEALQEASITARLMTLDQQLEDAQSIARRYKEIMLREKAYVPLTREGNWGIRFTRTEEGEDGEEIKTVAALVYGTTKMKALLAAEAWKKDHPELKDSNVVQGDVFNAETDVRKIKSPGLGTLERAARIAGMSDRTATDLINALETMEMENNYARTFKRHLRKAYGVLGYITDPVQAGAKYTAAAAKYAAHLLYTPEINDRIAALEADEVDGVSRHKDDIIYLRELAQDIFSNPVSAVAVRVTNTTAVSGLAFNPTFMVQQFLQKFTHEYPTFVAMYGSSEAIKYGSRAFQIATAMAGADLPGVTKKSWEFITAEQMKGLGSNPAELAQELREHMKRAEEEGIFMDQMRYETARAEHGKDSKWGKRLEKYQNAAFYFVGKTETHNRRQTYALQYLIARTKGFPVAPGLDHQLNPDKLGAVKEGYEMKILGPHAASVVAGKQVDWIHNRRGVTNRSKLQRKWGGVMMPMTQFKYFSPEYIQQLTHVYHMAYAQARNRGESKQVATLRGIKPVVQSLGWLIAMAGAAAGLPFISGLLDFFAMLLNDLIGPAVFKENFRPVRMFSTWLDESMIKAGAPKWIRNLVLAGTPSLLGVSMEHSLGLGDQFYVRRGDGLTLTAFKQGLGASSSLVKNVEQMGEAFKRREGLDFLASIPGVPKGARSLYRAMKPGPMPLGGGRTLDLTTGDRIKMALGAQPLNVGEARRIVEAQNWAAANKAEREKYYSNALADAEKQGDSARAERIRNARQAYNDDREKQGRTDELVKNRNDRSAIRNILGNTRKNQDLQERLNQ